MSGDPYIGSRWSLLVSTLGFEMNTPWYPLAGSSG